MNIGIQKSVRHSVNVHEVQRRLIVNVRLGYSLAGPQIGLLWLVKSPKVLGQRGLDLKALCPNL